MTIVAQFGEVWGLFEKIGDVIGDIFSGDWEGLKQSLENLWLGFLNFLIGWVNIWIAAINSVWGVIWSFFKGYLTQFVEIVEKIGNFLGYEWHIGTEWSNEMPEIPFIEKKAIPALAQGAVIPPNREFLAVLGDQKNGTNIETPLATMVEAFQMALDSRGGGGTEVVLEIDGREFGRAVIEQGGRESRRIGTRLVKI